ncbi:MAG: homoserine dehydrogenase [Lachnospiraceae bacterium]|nr:homoserine dehydrogenase [Lachnospiraceae bacterium]
MKAAIMGYGIVGGGIAKVLTENKSKVKQILGEECELGYILDLRDFPEDPYGDRVVRSLDEILADKEVRVICETMGGLKPAYEYTKRILQQGISVCTSNKELVAAHGAELLTIAKDHNCSYLFEASVGGGIPLLRPFSTTLMHERIDRVTGVLNGTTNYMLSCMQKGDTFDMALTRAQQKGYAEKDPTADIEGHDACRKIAILGSLAGGARVNTDDVQTEGITKLTEQDFEYARCNDYTIKLVAEAKLEGGAVGAVVAPFLVPMSHALASVNGVFNACIVHGNMLGDVMFYGQGAGRDATASAVVSDMIDALLHDGEHVFVNLSAVPALRMDDLQMTHRFFVRVDESEKAKAVKTFGEDISFVEARGVFGEWAFITAPMSEADFAAALKSLDEVRGYLRVLEA